MPLRKFVDRGDNRGRPASGSNQHWLIWRRVVGADNGSIDLTRPRRNDAHRIAYYIAKYVSKSIDDAVFNAKSYWSSKGIPKPKKTRLWFDADADTWDIVSLVAGDFVSRGYIDIAQFADAKNEFLWFSGPLLVFKEPASQLQQRRYSKAIPQSGMSKKRLLMAGVSKRELLDFLACCRAECQAKSCLECTA